MYEPDEKRLEADSQREYGKAYKAEVCQPLPVFRRDSRDQILAFCGGPMFSAATLGANANPRCRNSVKTRSYRLPGSHRHVDILDASLDGGAQRLVWAYPVLGILAG